MTTENTQQPSQELVLSLVQGLPNVAKIAEGVYMDISVPAFDKGTDGKFRPRKANFADCVYPHEQKIGAKVITRITPSYRRPSNSWTMLPEDYATKLPELKAAEETKRKQLAELGARLDALRKAA